MRYTYKGPLAEKDKHAAFDQSDPNDYIIRQAASLSDYIPKFGDMAAKELLVMLAAWLADPDNATEADHYFKRLGKENS